MPARNPRPNHGGGGSKFNLPRIPLKGLFGKGNNGGGSRPTYGAPKPSYGAPKPSYGGGAAPVGPPRPSYGGNNNNNGGSGYNNGGNGGGSFGPSNAIKMLPAPNLATGRPPVSLFYFKLYLKKYVCPLEPYSGIFRAFCAPSSLLLTI